MLFVHYLPDLTTAEELADGVVVVIDVLRASTTICHALAAGAREVVPCLTVDDARQTAGNRSVARRSAAFSSTRSDDDDAAERRATMIVLGGERQGLAIEGFDLGNSPSEYTAKSVGGKTVIFTTTNGTRAMMRCRQARRVLVGAFVNLSAICEQIRREASAGSDVHLLCAGTRGQITGEDVLFAGALVQRQTDETELNDQARLAAAAWNCVANACSADDGPTSEIDANRFAAYLGRSTQGGRNVSALGLADDLAAAAHVDKFDFAAELELAAWRVVPVNEPPR